MAGDAPEEMMRIMLNGMEVTIRVAGEAGIGLARILAQYAKRELDKKQADSPLIRLLRSGETLQMTVIPKDRYPEFRQLAGTKLLYAPVAKIGDDSELTVVFSGKQTALLRSILRDLDETAKERRRQEERAKKKEERPDLEKQEPARKEPEMPETEERRTEREPKPEETGRETEKQMPGPERKDREPEPDRTRKIGNRAGLTGTGEQTRKEHTGPRTGPEAVPLRPGRTEPAGTALAGQAERIRKEHAGPDLDEVVRQIQRRKGMER